MSLPADPASVEAMTGSYERYYAYSLQSRSHRHGAGGDLHHFPRHNSIQSGSHRRGVGGERHEHPKTDAPGWKVVELAGVPARESTGILTNSATAILGGFGYMLFIPLSVLSADSAREGPRGGSVTSRRRLISTIES
jgi:hypothetical protein